MALCLLSHSRSKASPSHLLRLCTKSTSFQRFTETRRLFSNKMVSMSEEDRYLFDLNGYIIVRNVFNEQEVGVMNKAIDNHASEMVERTDPALRNTTRGTAFSGTGPGRLDLGGVLEWGKEESNLFQSVLAHPKLLPYFHTLLGKGYRMDHLPFVIASNRGAEGFQLHGGGNADCRTGKYNPHLAYTCVRDTMHCALLGCNVMLVNHNIGDGGFCVVPGSHKSNFKMPPGMMDGEERFQKYIIQPETKAGDVVLFSEGTVHGAMEWKANYQRRSCLYRFAPATRAYGRSYFGHDDVDSATQEMGWPKAMYEGLNDAQRAVLEPPYANRLDRPNIIDEKGHVEMTTRNERKKQHDSQVFHTKYF